MQIISYEKYNNVPWLAYFKETITLWEFDFQSFTRLFPYIGTLLENMQISKYYEEPTVNLSDVPTIFLYNFMAVHLDKGEMKHTLQEMIEGKVSEEFKNTVEGTKIKKILKLMIDDLQKCIENEKLYQM